MLQYLKSLIIPELIVLISMSNLALAWLNQSVGQPDSNTKTLHYTYYRYYKYDHMQI